MRTPDSTPHGRPEAVESAIASRLPLVLGTGALGLYILGVVSTAGQLQASDIDVMQGMQLVAVERHLRSGVGVVASPLFLFVLFMYLLMGAVVLINDRATGRQPARPVAEPPASSRATRVGVSPRRRWLGWTALAVMTVYGLLRSSASSDRAEPSVRTSRARKNTRVDAWDVAMLPIATIVLIYLALTQPWPFVTLVAVVIASWLAPVLIWRRPNSRWKHRRGHLYLLINLVALSAIAFGDAYFRSDPLPRAFVCTDTRLVEGPLIAVNDGVVYVGDPSSERLFVAVSSDNVTDLQVFRRIRSPEKSVLELIGVGQPTGRPTESRGRPVPHGCTRAR